MRINSTWIIGTCLANVPWVLWLYFSFRFLHDIAQGNGLTYAILGAYLAGCITLYIIFYTCEVSSALRRWRYKKFSKKSRA